MWRRPECPRFTLPVAVFLKRLAAPLCDFSFGIVPRNQLPAASFQPSASSIRHSCKPGNCNRMPQSAASRRRLLSFRGLHPRLPAAALPLRFCLASFSFLLALPPFLRRQDGVQRVAFLPRPELYDALRFHVLDQPLQNLPAQGRSASFRGRERKSSPLLCLPRRGNAARGSSWSRNRGHPH